MVADRAEDRAMRSWGTHADLVALIRRAQDAIAAADSVTRAGRLRAAYAGVTIATAALIDEARALGEERNARECGIYHSLETVRGWLDELEGTATDGLPVCACGCGTHRGHASPREPDCMLRRELRDAGELLAWPRIALRHMDDEVVFGQPGQVPRGRRTGRPSSKGPSGPERAAGLDRG